MDFSALRPRLVKQAKLLRRRLGKYWYQLRHEPPVYRSREAAPSATEQWLRRPRGDIASEHRPAHGVILTPLWELTDDEGGRCLAGRLSSSATLFIFPNRGKEADTAPDYYAYLMTTEQDVDEV